MSEEIACIDCDIMVKVKKAVKYGAGWRCRACARIHDRKKGIKPQTVNQAFNEWFGGGD